MFFPGRLRASLLGSGGFGGGRRMGRFVGKCQRFWNIRWDQLGDMFEETIDFTTFFGIYVFWDQHIFEYVNLSTLSKLNKNNGDDIGQS